MPDSHDPWLALGSAARLLGVHPSTLRSWADKGEIASQRTAGGHRRFRRSDLEVWAVAHRGSSPVEPQVVVQNAIGRTRLELADGKLGRESWYRKLTDEQRTLYREGSRRLMRELIRYISIAGDAPSEEARQLGEDYARIGRRAGLTLQEAVEAFQFFREFLLDSIFSVYETAGVHSASAWGDMRRRMSRFTHMVLMALIDYYLEHMQSPPPASQAGDSSPKV
jgi:excisionase family DNA binding protein